MTTNTKKRNAMIMACAALILAVVAIVSIAFYPARAYAEEVQIEEDGVAQVLSVETRQIDLADETVNETTTVYAIDNGYEVEFSLSSARGILCTMTVDIKGKDGWICGTLKNTFTLGTSVIPAYVELCYATEKTNFDANKKMVASRDTADLNMGHSISAEYGAYGKTLYWQARARWNMDNKGWQTKNTDIVLFDGNANKI